MTLGWLLLVAALSASIGAVTACAVLALLAALLVGNFPRILAALGRLLSDWISQAI